MIHFFDTYSLDRCRTFTYDETVESLDFALEELLATREVD